jgi:hypothetical protein
MMRLTVATMVAVMAVAGSACLASAGSAGAAPVKSWADLGFDVRIERDGVRIGGRVLGPGGPFGAWLGGALRERGLRLEGGVEGPRGPHEFRLDLDADLAFPSRPRSEWPRQL